MTTTERDYRLVFDIIERFRPLGSRTLEDGTELIGHVPHVAPEAWLHIRFRPLEAEEVVMLETQLGRGLSPGHREFLLHANGLSLFSGSLAVYGHRHTYARRGDARWQPFSIVEPNMYERPHGSQPADLFLGGYEQDGSLIYTRSPAPFVHRCSRSSAHPVNTWPSLPGMLASETLRLSELFDDRGVLRHHDADLTPGPGIDR